MSRMAAAFLLVFSAPAAASGPPVTAEQAMENYRAMFEPVDSSRCRLSSDTDEIVVCGRRESARLPLPVDPEPGRRIRGDIQSGTSAMSGHGCIRTCPQPLKVDLIGAAKAIAHGIDRLIHDE